MKRGTESVIDGVELIKFDIHGDERGSLVAIENRKDINFSMKRVYYIYGTGENVVRGKHAHKNLNQVLVCVSGSCDIFVYNGKQKETVHLSERNEGIYIHGFVWREMMNFTKDAVLLAIVDQEYNTQDYVYDIGEVEEAAKDGRSSS